MKPSTRKVDAKTQDLCDKLKISVDDYYGAVTFDKLLAYMGNFETNFTNTVSKKLSENSEQIMQEVQAVSQNQNAVNEVLKAHEEVLAGEAFRSLAPGQATSWDLKRNANWQHTNRLAGIQETRIQGAIDHLNELKSYRLKAEQERDHRMGLAELGFLDSTRAKTITENASTAAGADTIISTVEEAVENTSAALALAQTLAAAK